ncbi:MAG: tetratricopeptide repeat protein [Acidobacteriota bacterium]
MVKQQTVILVGLLGINLLLSGSVVAQQRRFGVNQPATEKKEDRRFGVDSTGKKEDRRFGVDSSSYFSAPNRRFGVQQVGEAKAEAIRQSNPRPAVSGPEALVTKAERLVDQGEVKRAQELYLKALEIQPQLASARLGLGYLLLELGDYDNAAQEFQQAVTYTPKDSQAILNLGVAFYRGGRIDEAIKQYENALAESKGQLVAGHFNLAMAYAHKSDFNKAIEHYQAAIKLRKNYPEAYNNLGLIYEASGDLAMAGEQFRLAIEQRRGNYPLAHYNLARFYHGNKKYQEAIAEFQLAIKQQPNFPEAYLDLGNIYLLRTSLFATNELEQAAAAYRKALELRKDDYALAHENLAITLTEMGKKEEALAQYRIAFAQYQGRCPEALHNLIATITEKKSFLIGNELSRLDSPGNLKPSKNSTGLNERLIAALSKYEELDEEEKDLPQVHYCIGRAYTVVGKWSEAANEFALASKQVVDDEAKQALNSLLQLARYF